MDEVRTIKKLTAGILAHVDAGKTTLAEALLFRAGMLRKLGRVDHRDTFLDTHALERERGITIFSKQARLRTDELELTLLDTPGHADLSGETERAVSAMDVAILVISGTDGSKPTRRPFGPFCGGVGCPPLSSSPRWTLPSRAGRTFWRI